MQDLGWRRRWGSCPAARRGARQRAGLTPASSFNTLHACWRCFTQNSSGQSKCCLTVITVSTATARSRHGTAIGWFVEDEQNEELSTFRLPRSGFLKRWEFITLLGTWRLAAPAAADKNPTIGILAWGTQDSQGSMVRCAAFLAIGFSSCRNSAAAAFICSPQPVPFPLVMQRVPKTEAASCCGCLTLFVQQKQTCAKDMLREYEQWPSPGESPNFRPASAAQSPSF